MRLVFKGWGRQEKIHHHDVIPVTTTPSGYRAGEIGDPLAWTNALKAYGKVNGLSLGGSYLVEFDFEPEERRHWLRQFALSEPEAAVKLFAEMQAEAILALAGKTAERAAEKSAHDADVQDEAYVSSETVHEG